jgi:hypothetical protein
VELPEFFGRGARLACLTSARPVANRLGSPVTARASDGGALVRVTSRPGESHDIPLDYSPNGKWLVFYRSATVNPDDQVGGSLWVVGVDGSDPHQVAGSPDGSHILFALDPTNDEFTHPDNGLYTVTARGTDLQLVNGSHDCKRQPEWWQ